MAESVVKTYFPSQTVSDAEKLSYDYGLKVAKAIETEWFNEDRNIVDIEIIIITFII